MITPPEFHSQYDLPLDGNVLILERGKAELVFGLLDLI